MVRYVDETNPNQVLWTYTLPTNYATEGQYYNVAHQLVQFPGYTFSYVTGSTTGRIEQPVKPGTDLKQFLRKILIQLRSLTITIPNKIKRVH